MLSAEEKERYSRQIILDNFGEDAQLKLKQAKVLVVGAGGLGCPVLTYLASAGIGNIGIIDNDKVSLSNLPRQTLYTTENIGEYKVEAAKKRLNQQNPLSNIRAYNERITIDNVLIILQRYDIVVDGTDNFQTRYLLNDACVMLGKPLVYGAIFKFEGQVSVFNYHNGPTYRCLFPEPPEDMPSCNEAGVVGVMPGIVGMYQAMEVIKIVTQLGEVLSGKLLTFNLLNNTIDLFEYPSTETNRHISELKVVDYTCRHTDEIDFALFEQWKKEKKIQLIDVRNTHEFTTQNTGGINIPLSELENHLADIDPKSVLVIRCKTGVRARHAAEILKSKFSDTEVYVRINTI